MVRMPAASSEAWVAAPTPHKMRKGLGRSVKMVLAWGMILLGLMAVYGLWGDITRGLRPSQQVGAAEVTLPRAEDGHYYAQLQIQGQEISFMVDTGASDVVLTQADARKLGFDPAGLLGAKGFARIQSLADAVEGDAKTRARIRFAVEQWMAAMAPSNYLAFNVEAQKKAIETKGESIAKGMQNLLHDMKQGHVSMTDESVFEVGKNVATTEGAVVFENELFQLIEYKPLTAKVFERPFLLVPPCINKFYILDLQPENSFIRYCVEQGHRTFVVSWRNPDESLAKKTWDNYIEDAVIRAINVTQDITGAEQINALGFCVGGTMLGTALAVLAGRGEEPVHSATFLTTLLDFRDTGILDLFIDEPFVQFREMQFADGGLMPGRDLATTFSFLRPNDLVWNYVVGNYLKGETPPPFDLLYWNSDSTNLPGPYYAWYLRHLYLENRYTRPGATTAVLSGPNFAHEVAKGLPAGQLTRETRMQGQLPADVAREVIQCIRSGKQRIVLGHQSTQLWLASWALSLERRNRMLYRMLKSMLDPRQYDLVRRPTAESARPCTDNNEAAR